jgi:aspartate aminotransferase-like enzyme
MIAMTPERAPINPPDRLLCGPGPSNVEPAVLAAMQKPMLGHLDPDMHEILHEVVDLLRVVYKAPDGLVIPLQATGTSGMETGLACLVQPGDTAIVGVCGFFGRRIVEIARRYGANVVEVEADTSSRSRPTGATTCPTPRCSRRSSSTPTRAWSPSCTPRRRPACSIQ